MMDALTLDDPLLTSDVMYGGKGFFAGEDAGIVTVAGNPARRRILCFDRRTMHIVRDTWSNSDGTYRLSHLDPNRDYLLLALDHKGQYEPIGYDFIRPTVEDD